MQLKCQLAHIWEFRLYIWLRIPVSLIVKLIASGKTVQDILDDYPELEEGDVKQALEYAAWATSERSFPVPA